MIYSGDLQPAEKSWAITEEKIPIVELFGEQRLILEVEAVLGLGRNHAKWQAVQSPGYRMEPQIEFDKKRLNDVKVFIEKLPKDLVKIKDNKLEISDIKQMSVLESYMDQENVDFITIKKDINNVIFSFETDGSFSARDALLESAKILENKYSELGNLLKNI